MIDTSMLVCMLVCMLLSNEDKASKEEYYFVKKMSIHTESFT